MEEQPTGTTSPPPKRGLLHGLRAWFVVAVVAALIALLLRVFVLQTFFVPSCSMWPTLRPGDRMLVLKVGDSLSRGAIVVFTRPARDYSAPAGEDLVKRIIGLPGETIWSRNDTVYIDGRPIAQPWLPRQERDALGQPIRRQTIRAGDYFMLGDFRGNSYDSRYWGQVPGTSIIGRVMLVVWRDNHPALHTVGGQASMPKIACPT